jgi:rubrerythrin
MTETPHGALGPASTGRPDPAPLPPDAPAAVARLYQTFRTHEMVESDTLTAYRRLAGATSDPVVRLVLGLVIADEERHHELMRRIGATLRDKLYWTTSPDTFPSDEPRAMATDEERTAIARFVEQEQAGAHQLYALARDGAWEDDGLCATLIEGMAADSATHERLLRYVLKRLTAASGRRSEAKHPRRRGAK